MSVSAEYRTFLVELLGRLVPLRTRSMFGEMGLYADDVFFAVAADDRLYFKVDDSNRPDYEAAGTEPFAPKGHTVKSRQYYEVPVEVQEDREELRAWLEKTLEVARRAHARKRPRR